MPDNPFTRRLLTITCLVIIFAGVTATLPILLGAAALIDIARTLTGRSGVTLRGLAFLWLYLLGELGALVALGVTAPLPHSLRERVTYRLQAVWAAWNLRALESLFSLEIHAEGVADIAPGPIVVLSRHASMVDTLLPARLITRQAGIRLRYVLKRELQVDPALDIAGNRLRNAFIDRRSRETSERQLITKLAESLGEEDGILIYPEGTRFSEAKLRRLRRVHEESGADGAHAPFRRVLPPRPGGTLALLDATTADVVVLAHRGLEGLATVREIWAGDLVGSRVDVRLWRVRRDEIPLDRAGRVEWLNRLWADMDEWVTCGPPMPAVPS